MTPVKEDGDAKKKIAPQIQKMRAQIAAMRKKRSPLVALQGDELISVEQISSQLSLFYEKMRNSVDYKEGHLIKRNAIKRMLKRRLQEQFRRGKIAPFLIIELVRAGYLPNNELPERIINDVDIIIQKILTLYEAIPGTENEILGTSKEFDRIVGLAAIEIEEYLFAPDTAHACLDAFYLTVYDLIELRDVKIPIKEQNMQTYIACMRSLLGYDESDLFYKIWNMHHPSWKNQPSVDEIVSMGKNFNQHVENITKVIEHPLNWRIVPKLRDYAIYFALMRESASKKPEKWCSKKLDISVIKKHVDEIISETYNTEHQTIAKSVNRAIIYILLTKTILALLIELPYDLWESGKINRVALAVNIFFHPFILFVATRVVRLPREDSRTQTIDGIASIIENKKLPQISVNCLKRRSIFGLILSMLYIFFFVLIFSAIIYTLKTLHFNIVSGGLFVFFLTLVSYFALRIRGRAQKWRVTPKNVSAKVFLIDLLTLPIIQSGQWITKRFDSINIFVFIMDFLIETPFKVIVDIFEGFTHYLREKKERLE